MSINSPSIFEVLTSIVRLIKHIRLCDKTFPITNLSYCYHQSTNTGLVEIELIPIYHTSAQNLRHIYFDIITYYLDVVESLPGVTRSSIQNVCTEFGIYIYQFLL